MTGTSAPDRHSVRQQLDELDALLQRMLALPQNGDGATPAPRPNDPATPTPMKDAWKAQTMTLLNTSDPVSPPNTPEPSRWDPNWAINLNPQNGSSILGDRSPAAATYRPPSAASPVAVSRPEPAAFTMPDAPPATPPQDPPAVLSFPEPPFRPRAGRSAPLPPIAWPFAALDSLFDAVAGLFPFGSLLTTRLGKNFVGLVGIAMSIGGLAWGALVFLGWSRF